MNAEQHIIEALNQIRAAAPQPVKLNPDVEADLRAAAADWMETEIGRVYGQTVLDILEGR